MGLNASRTRLHANLKELLARWDRTKARWNDPRSREFEGRYLAPLEPGVRHTADAMERMGEVLARATRECGPGE